MSIEPEDELEMSTSGELASMLIRLASDLSQLPPSKIRHNLMCRDKETIDKIITILHVIVIVGKQMDETMKREIEEGDAYKNN